MHHNEYLEAKQQLRDAAKAYYTDGTSPLSDADYDKLLFKVAEHEAFYGTDDLASEQVAVGAVSGDVRHSSPMLSLDNVFDRKQLDRWADALGDDPTIVIEPKLDGLAMVVHYEDGKPTRMVTRGDGTHGEDVSKALRLIDNIPGDLGRFSGELRGEVIFSTDQFKVANDARVASGKPAFANPRNAAAGTVNRAAQGGDVPAGTKLSFVVYDWTDAEHKWSNHVEAMHALAAMGFTVAIDLLQGITVTLDTKPVIGFDIDGLVYKINDFAVRNRLGFTSRAPRWARAFKYPPEVAITTLVDVLWQVGRTGSVTPRAVLQPVSVGGTTITYATLHNPSEIARKGLYLGARVEVRRAAEVIPEVVGLAAQADPTGDRIDIPAHCPNCGETLLTNEARLRCPSGGECALDRKLTYAVSRDAFDIDGMSEALVTALIEAGKLKDVSDLFNLTVTNIATCPTGRMTDGGSPITFGDTIAKKIMAEIKRARSEVTFERVLIALGLTGTGRSMSKRLAQHFGSMECLLDATVADIEQVEKVGKIKAKQIHGQLHRPDMLRTIARLELADLAMEIEQAAGPQPLVGMTIVVTGTMRQLGSRSEVTGNLEALGATVGSSVSGKTTLVVADDPEGTSSKLVKARKLGVRIVDEATFVQEFGI